MGLGSRILSRKVKGSGPECPHVLGARPLEHPAFVGVFGHVQPPRNVCGSGDTGVRVAMRGSRLRSAPAGALYLDEVRET